MFVLYLKDRKISMLVSPSIIIFFDHREYRISDITVLYYSIPPLYVAVKSHTVKLNALHFLVGYLSVDACVDMFISHL